MPEEAAPPAGYRADLGVIGVRGIGEVRAGDDLAGLLAGALGEDGLADGDIVVVSSKVVSKAEGRSLRADGREEAIRDQTVRVVAERITPRGLTQIVQSRSGPVMAAAGVDASNVEPGTVLLLPADPDASARALRAALRERTGRRVAVVVSDTAGRAWRDGQADLAVGCAGVAALEDLRGAVDGHGNTLEVTVRALADQLAAAADLVKGKLDGVPAAVVRGLPGLVTDDDGPGAAVLLRDAGADWFRYGHLEAVRAALGAPPGTVPPAPVVPGDAAARLERAAEVTRTAGAWTGASVQIAVMAGPLAAATATVTATADASGTTTGSDPQAPALIGLGATVERLLAAAWAEDLTVTVRHLAAGPPATALLTAEIQATR